MQCHESISVHSVVCLYSSGSDIINPRGVGRRQSVSVSVCFLLAIIILFAWLSKGYIYSVDSSVNITSS